MTIDFKWNTIDGKNIAFGMTIKKGNMMWIDQHFMRVLIYMYIHDKFQIIYLFHL